MIPGNNIRLDDALGVVKFILITKITKIVQNKTSIQLSTLLAWQARHPSMLAVTSCEWEHSISHLQIIKTCLSSTMTETCFTGLALLYTHKGIACDAATVVEKYAWRHLRHLQLSNPYFTNMADYQQSTLSNLYFRITSPAIKHHCNEMHERECCRH